MEREAFVAAIRAEPDRDDRIRVYADWLLDRGEVRGELINLELDIAAGHATALEKRRDELLARHHREWLRPLEDLGATRLALDRGLVTSVSLTGRALANLQAICELEPVIGATLNSGGRGPSRAAAESAAMADMRWLILAGRHAAGVAAILGSPRLARLESLSVFHDLTAELAAALARGAARPATLRVKPDQRGAEILATSGVLERVADLAWAGLGGTLGAARSLPALRRLKAEHLVAADLAAIGPRLDHLEKLECYRLDAGAVDVLLAHVRGGRLRHLVVDVHDPNAQTRLLGSPVLAGVEELDMQSTVLCPEAIAALRASPHRGALRSMWLPAHGKRDRFELPGVYIEWEGW